MTMLSTAMSRDEFEAFANAAVRAIALVEGWDDQHPGWQIIEDASGEIRTVASRAFLKTFREVLEEAGFRVLARRRVAPRLRDLVRQQEKIYRTCAKDLQAVLDAARQLCAEEKA